MAVLGMSGTGRLRLRVRISAGGRSKSQAHQSDCSRSSLACRPSSNNSSSRGAGRLASRQKALPNGTRRWRRRAPRAQSATAARKAADLLAVGGAAPGEAGSGAEWLRGTSGARRGEAAGAGKRLAPASGQLSGRAPAPGAAAGAEGPGAPEQPAGSGEGKMEEKGGSGGDAGGEQLRVVKHELRTGERPAPCRPGSALGCAGRGGGPGGPRRLARSFPGVAAGRARGAALTDPGVFAPRPARGRTCPSRVWEARLARGGGATLSSERGSPALAFLEAPAVPASWARGRGGCPHGRVDPASELQALRALRAIIVKYRTWP